MRPVRVTNEQFESLVAAAVEDHGTDGWAWLQWRRIDSLTVEVRGSYEASDVGRTIVGAGRVVIGE
jgi:hypothetical protein